MKITATLVEATQVAALATSDQLNRTETHIPGWVVRGAFASSWLRARANRMPSGRFEMSDAERALFVETFEGGVRFSPLFVKDPPTSLSVFGHKYEGKDRSHRLDTALKPNFAAPEDCPSCGATFESKRGLVEAPPARTRTSVSIGDAETAREGLLFSRRSLEPSRLWSQQQFASTLTGWLTGSETGLAQLKDLTTIRLGGRRTTQGLTALEISAGEPTVDPEILDDGTLILRLTSPAVLIDGTGRPVNRPTDAYLSGALGLGVRVVKAWTRWERIGGWHMASGLPKHTELTVTAGSTFAVRALDGGGIPRDSATQLLRDGLGLRRHEGFGHLRPQPPGPTGAEGTGE